MKLFWTKISVYQHPDTNVENERLNPVRQSFTTSSLILFHVPYVCFIVLDATPTLNMPPPPIQLGLSKIEAKEDTVPLDTHATLQNLVPGN
jgi:hypothetical protein